MKPISKGNRGFFSGVERPKQDVDLRDIRLPTRRRRDLRCSAILRP